MSRFAVSSKSAAFLVALCLAAAVGAGAAGIAGCSGGSNGSSGDDSPQPASPVAEADEGANRAADDQVERAKERLAADRAQRQAEAEAKAKAEQDAAQAQAQAEADAAQAAQGSGASGNPSGDSSAGAVVPAPPEGSTFKVTYFDVGQGDAALVECDGAYLLVDGGPPEASSLLYSALSRDGVSHLDYVVATHPDTDHTGGIAGALEVAGAGRALCSVTQADQRSFNAMVERLSSQNVELEVPEVGDSFQLGSSLVQVIGPVVRTDDGDANNDSIMLKITYGQTVFVFAGDADDEEEKGAATFLDGCDVLKVAHHGSAGSSCYAFLRAALPKNAVISCSADNSYGHPTDEALSRLRDCGAAVYRTDMQGDVVAESDGSTVTLSVERNADADTLVAGPGGGLAAGGGAAAGGSQASAGSDVSSGGTDEESYIGNKNSKKFHRPSCSTLPAEHNRVYFGSRQEAVDAGMAPCKRCNP